MEKEKLKQELEKIVKKYKSYKNAFPFLFCSDITFKLFYKFKLFCINGGYVGHFDQEYLQAVKDAHLPIRKKGYTHCFSYDPESKLFADITACQFDKSLPEILIFGITDPRIALSLDQKNIHTTHYIRSSYANIRNKPQQIEIFPNGEWKFKEV